MKRTNTLLLTILVVYLLGFAAHAFLLKKTVYGDGIFYYSWIRSAVVDGDIDFTNEYRHFGVSQPISASGLPGNKYSIGAPILWYPAFAFTHRVIRGNGYEFPYQLAVGFSSVCYTWIGLLLLYRLLRKDYSETVSLSSVIGITFASNALYYGSLDTVNSHAVSFFASTLFLTLIHERKPNWFRIGAALGLVSLIRVQDILIGLIALPLLKPRSGVSFVSGWLYVFISQLLVWQILNLAFWKSPYVSSIEGFDFLHPHIIGVLFGPNAGIFLWTPIVLIGIVGLFLRKNDAYSFSYRAVILFQIYLVSSWSVWWQGASFSGRMFVGMLPVVAIGLCEIVKRCQNKLMGQSYVFPGFVAPLSIINGFLIVFFLLTR